MLVKAIYNSIKRRIRHRGLLAVAREDTLRKIEKIRPKSILVLCHGNIYRSPYVAHRLKDLLSDLTPYQVEQAGFHKRVNRESPEPYQEYLRARGVDLSTHRSRLINKELIDWSDAILIMDCKNWDELSSLHMGGKEKVLWLGAFGKGESVQIEDPYNKPMESVAKVVDAMESSVQGFVGLLRSL